MEKAPQTWHYGLIAKWWSEFNDDFRPHEIPYFQKFIERDGQPALDVGCGTGRLLLPYLRAGLDVDACDVSADMVELCREKAAREGLSRTCTCSRCTPSTCLAGTERSMSAGRSGSGARVTGTPGPSSASTST